MWFFQMLGSGMAFAFGAVIGGAVGMMAVRFTTKEGREQIRAENEIFREEQAKNFAKQYDALIRIAEVIATKQK